MVKQTRPVYDLAQQNIWFLPLWLTARHCYLLEQQLKYVDMLHVCTADIYWSKSAFQINFITDVAQQKQVFNYGKQNRKCV